MSISIELIYTMLLHTQCVYIYNWDREPDRAIELVEVTQQHIYIVGFIDCNFDLMSLKLMLVKRCKQQWAGL